jgi:hypothetical protein
MVMRGELQMHPAQYTGMGHRIVLFTKIGAQAELRKSVRVDGLDEDSPFIPRNPRLKLIQAAQGRWA